MVIGEPIKRTCERCTYTSSQQIYIYISVYIYRWLMLKIERKDKDESAKTRSANEMDEERCKRNQN